MPRQNRSSLPDGAFHVIAHAVASEPLFYDDVDRKIYLGLLEITIERYRWRVVSFVLLDTHVHALVIATTSDLSDGLWWLHTRYAKRFYARHPQRRGHLFERRPRTKPIRDEAYFSAVLRYIALNPVKAFICSRPEDYRWSAHRAIVGAGPPLPFLALDDINARFRNDPDQARERYATFVLGEDPPEHGRVRRWSEEPPSDRPSLGELLNAGPEPSVLRAAHEEWGYTVREIAAAAGISIGTVSNRIARDRQS
jgi:REP element-mobilizing transposase RayT